MLDGDGGQCHTPAPLPPGRDLVPIVHEVGWAMGWVWIGVENLTPPGFYPQTIQPVASHHTHCAILANKQRKKKEGKILLHFSQ